MPEICVTSAAVAKEFKKMLNVGEIPEQVTGQIFYWIPWSLPGQTGEPLSRMELIAASQLKRISGTTCSRMGTTVWSRYWRVGRDWRSCLARLLVGLAELLDPSLLLLPSSSSDLLFPSEPTPDTTPEDSSIT